MGPNSLSCYELPRSPACLPSLYTWGKLRSESPETGPRSRTGGVLPPWVSCPASGLLSTYGRYRVIGIGDPPTNLQGGPDLSQDMISVMGLLGRAHGVGGWEGC